jgi:hypothetical protein
MHEHLDESWYGNAHSLVTLHVNAIVDKYISGHYWLQEQLQVMGLSWRQFP